MNLPPTPTLSALFEHQRTLRAQIRFRDLLGQDAWFQDQLDSEQTTIRHAEEAIERLRFYRASRLEDKARLERELLTCEEEILSKQREQARLYLHPVRTSTTQTAKPSKRQQLIADFAALMSCSLEKAEAICYPGTQP